MDTIPVYIDIHKRNCEGGFWTIYLVFFLFFHLYTSLGRESCVMSVGKQEWLEMKGQRGSGRQITGDC